MKRNLVLLESSEREQLTEIRVKVHTPDRRFVGNAAQDYWT